ncbi:MAG TPA: HIT domain-containing protein [Bryobacteraceae bacterium]|jgi:ATP adenylyltransferase
MKEKRDPQCCIFCIAAAGTADEENLVVYRGPATFAILNKYPYTSGHLMIAPYEHVSRLSRAREDSVAEMMRVARWAESILEDLYCADGLNIGINLGEAAGAGIKEHIHLHVLPRWTGDANFMTSVGATRVLPEALEETYAKLKHAFR